MAGEEPSMAGAVRRPPRDYREYQSDRHPFLYGHEGKTMFKKKRGGGSTVVIADLLKRWEISVRCLTCKKISHIILISTVYNHLNAFFFLKFMLEWVFLAIANSFLFWQEAQNSHVYWVSHKLRWSKATPNSTKNSVVVCFVVVFIVFLCEPVALLHPSRELGQRGGAAEGTALEDLQPVRNAGDGQRQRSGGTCEYLKWKNWKNL